MPTSSQELHMHVLMKKAEMSDVEIVSSILSEAALYLESIEQPLWKCDELMPGKISDDIGRGEYYIAYHDGEPVGTLKYQLEDKLFWPEIPEGTSGFVHRVAIRRRVASKGVSRQMLEWAKEHTREIERQYLRLDCAIRPKLCNVYERNGFTEDSERQVGPYLVARYICNVQTCEQSEPGR
ncbi:GNAT family N-acetyltransferase [Candidatus Hydrogenedentota bacterium]